MNWQKWIVEMMVVSVALLAVLVLAIIMLTMLDGLWTWGCRILGG